MKYVTFGKTGKKVSILGMGGMRFEKEIPVNECVSFLHYANELGINYFETGPEYNDDRSEDIYGKALRNMPTDNWYISTKARNTKTAGEVEGIIENSLRRLRVDVIHFYLLWCIINPGQYSLSKKAGRSLEAIFKAKEKGLIEHIGVSTHMYSDEIKKIADDSFFEFLLMPYNALNFVQRTEGLRYAKDHNLGTVSMNPVYGGVIPQYRDILKIYPDSTRSPVEDAMAFCLQSPYIDVTLSGMNSKKMVKENVAYVEKFDKISPEEHDRRESKIQTSFSGLCTSCGYCMPHCPEEINIKSYMEVYNNYMLTKDIEVTKERYSWYSEWGPLFENMKKAADCTECGECESACTQYLDIRKRLKWISETFEK
jgi:predicted aldo/keto reductase-like oxidoreductase